jgi:hypothetical protein
MHHRQIELMCLLKDFEFEWMSELVFPQDLAAQALKTPIHLCVKIPFSQ